ncbi:MAG TPA: universal stress protein [Acidimicrobiia bacterium]|nr:universal stress protein [Acidimicrobiia bacterium]
MKTIVVGVNDSAASDRAVRWSASIADAVHARVIAVFAVSRVGIWELAALQVNSDPVVREYERRLKGAWTQPLREAGVAYDTRLERGGTADALLRVTAEEDADLIVIGGRRHNGGESDPTHRLLKRATKPLVIVPERQ